MSGLAILVQVAGCLAGTPIVLDPIEAIPLPPPPTSREFPPQLHEEHASALLAPRDAHSGAPPGPSRATTPEPGGRVADLA